MVFVDRPNTAAVALVAGSQIILIDVSSVSCDKEQVLDQLPMVG